MLYLLKKIKKYCYIPAKGTFHLSTDFCITVQAPKIYSLFLLSLKAEKNNHTAQGLFHHYETITIINDTGKIINLTDNRR